MSLASIQRIVSLVPIDGADRIECAQVLEYYTVVQRGVFRVGDLCIWHSPDTVLPARDEYAFAAKDQYRLRCRRIRGVVSQGLALPLQWSGVFHEGDDVTERVGIVKYEKPTDETVGGSRFPDFLKRTDEPNLRSEPAMLRSLQGTPVVCTLKLDGTSVTYYLRDGEFGVCSRNMRLEPPKPDVPNNVYFAMAHEHDIERKLRAEARNLALQGECCGPRINGNHLGATQCSLACFSLYDIDAQQYLGHDALVAFCTRHALPLVPVVHEYESFALGARDLVALANTLEYSAGRPAEGIVVRPRNEQRLTHGRRLSGKVISERFLLKYNE